MSSCIWRCNGTYRFHPEPGSQTDRETPRYFAAAGTSLLAIGLLFACEAHGVISQGIDAVILTILTREISLLAGSTREA